MHIRETQEILYNANKINSIDQEHPEKTTVSPVQFLHWAVGEAILMSKHKNLILLFSVPFLQQIFS
jgi:hypothetical protein